MEPPSPRPGAPFIEDDARWRELTTETNKLRRRRNKISSEIAKVMKEDGSIVTPKVFRNYMNGMDRIEGALNPMKL